MSPSQNFRLEQLKWPAIKTWVGQLSSIVNANQFFLYFFVPLPVLLFVMQPTAACCFLYFLLINNIILIFSPLVASPSVTCVRQEESNYWILALRSACFHESPSVLSSFSSGSRQQLSEQWKMEDVNETKDYHWLPENRKISPWDSVKVEAEVFSFVKEKLVLCMKIILRCFASWGLKNKAEMLQIKFWRHLKHS